MRANEWKIKKKKETKRRKRWSEKREKWIRKKNNTRIEKNEREKIEWGNWLRFMVYCLRVMSFPRLRNSQFDAFVSNFVHEFNWFLIRSIYSCHVSLIIIGQAICSTLTDWLNTLIPKDFRSEANDFTPNALAWLSIYLSLTFIQFLFRHSSFVWFCERNRERMRRQWDSFGRLLFWA